MYGEQWTIFTPSALHAPKNRTTSTSTTITSFKSKTNWGPLSWNCFFQFPDVLRLKVPNQTSPGPAAVRIPFDLQVRSPRLKRHSSGVNATGVPTQFVESA